MAECINHPGKEGIYRCSKCKKHFCLACVELIEDKAYCYDCLREIVKEVREDTKKSLTLQILFASLLALLVAIVSLRQSYTLLAYIPGYVYARSVGSKVAFDNTLLYEVPALVIGLGFLALCAGLATTKKWSYRYGLIVSVIVFVYELVEAMNYPGGIDLLKADPNLSIFYGIMVIVPILVLVLVFGSRRELLGW